MNQTLLPTIAVVIPCYKVKSHILGVLEAIGQDINKIYVVDDACPEQSGAYVAQEVNDPRVMVLSHEQNQGVGGAVVTGYKQALKDDIEIVVKLDGDGQMDPALIPALIAPIVAQQADYAKGNRFYLPEDIASMPLLRVIGNACASFFSKLSAGYWHLFDPTNGFTAIHRKIIDKLPLDKIHKRYFFESDILFRLNILGACVVDVPMKGHYGDEKSNLKVRSNLFPFMGGYMRNFFKRIIYNYYLRDFSMASLELLFGLLLLGFGICFGAGTWLESILENEVASAGTIMLAALPIILGFQLILSFVNYDIAVTPRTPLYPRLLP